MLLAAASARATGRGAAVLLTAGAAVLGSRPGPESERARTVLVATAEETIWRSAPAWAILPFALMHRPVHPRTWPYHLLTGAAFTVAERAGGLVAAAAVHSAHNLWIDARRNRGPRTTQPAVGAGVNAPSSTVSNRWPVSVAKEPQLQCDADSGSAVVHAQFGVAP